MPDRDVYTVSRLNRETKSLLEGSFPLLWVEGEISNLSRPASGHLYFSLKDDQAQVRAALFRGNRRGLTTEPRDGMQVLVRARVSLYEGRGDYQLIVDTLEEAGEGALRRAFDQLKFRLEREGLFARELKKPLPPVPRRIGVITSPTGAVIHDIVTTLGRRFPAIPVLVHPVPVQGPGAAEQIARVIRLASERLDCDVLIVARGGGSLEDLWAFNDEIVARAIHQCRIPVVSAIGHETDFTISDFVADVRAPTPTAAAEMLSPDQTEWRRRLDRTHRQLARLIVDRLHNAQQNIDYLSARLVHPDSRLAQIRGQLNVSSARLLTAWRQSLVHTRQRILSLHAQLKARNPLVAIRDKRRQLDYSRSRLADRMQGQFQREAESLARLTQLLEALSPLSTLARGYAVVRRTDGVIVRSRKQVQTGDPVRIQLAAGRLNCRIEGSSDED